MISIDPHPHLEAACFLSHFPRPLGELPSPPSVLRYFGAEAAPPVPRPEEAKAAVRDLLRHGGFKPTGRNKPASEYLLKAIEKGWFSPERGINIAVDACNAASLHSGLPISVIDADKASASWRIGVCPPETRYVFNPSGQVIDVSGLLSFFDAEGPCAGPVKDSQRTKTDEGTVRTLSIVWGTAALEGHTARTLSWYLELLAATDPAPRVERLLL